METELYFILAYMKPDNTDNIYIAFVEFDRIKVNLYNRLKRGHSINQIELYESGTRGWNSIIMDSLPTKEDINTSVLTKVRNNEYIWNVTQLNFARLNPE